MLFVGCIMRFWNFWIGKQSKLEMSKSTEKLLKTITDLVIDRSWNELLKMGEKLLQDNSSSREAIELIAYSLQQAGQIEDVIKISIPAINLFPNYWIFPYLTGCAFHNLGKFQEATAYLRLANSIRPNDQQTIKELIQAIAASEGIGIAALEYAAIGGCELGDSSGVRLMALCTTYDWAIKKGEMLIDLGDAEEIPFITPMVLNQSPIRDIKFNSSNKPYVVELKDTRIFGKSSIILVSDDVALSDTGGDKRFGDLVKFSYEKIVLARQGESVLVDCRGYKTRKIEAAIFLSGLASDAFGHWLPEFLPKLEFLQRHPEYHSFPIVVDADMPKSHFDHLARLTGNSLILLQQNESLICSRLLVSPSPTFFPVETFPNDLRVNKLSVLSPRALRFVRANDFSRITSRSNHRKIFLRRKNRSWRRLINEEEIATNLRSIGFEDIFTEEMNAGDQIDLFRQAKYIVAPNGSALLNLIFANTDTKVLILIQPNLHNYVTLQSPLEAMGYEILAVCGDYAVSENQKHSDFSVPMPRIYEALSKLGLK